MTTVKKKLAIFHGDSNSLDQSILKFLSEDSRWRIVVRDLHPAFYAKPSIPDAAHQMDTVRTLANAQVSAALGANLYTAVLVVAGEGEDDEFLRWYDVANESGAEVEIFEANSDGSYTLSDTVRINSFGDAYVPNHDLPKAVWLDVDGTAFTMFDEDGIPLRGPFEYHKVNLDTPLYHTINVVKALQSAGYKVVVMSGREESCKEDTLRAFEDVGVLVDDIFMRPVRSNIPDDQLKYTLFYKHVAPKYNVEFAFDDRDKVVKMLRTVLKIPVYQVNYGAF